MSLIVHTVSCGRNVSTELERSSDLKSCVKDEVDVPGSPSRNNSPYGLCGRKATFDLISRIWLAASFFRAHRSRVKVQMDVLLSPSLITIRTVSVHVRQHCRRRNIQLCLKHCLVNLSDRRDPEHGLENCPTHAPRMTSLPELRYNFIAQSSGAV